MKKTLRTTLVLCGAVIAASLAAQDQPATQLDDLEYARQVKPIVQIVLNDGAQVQGNRLFLDNVASCGGAPSLCDELVGIDLGECPPPGSSKVIRSDLIASAIKHDYPDLVFELLGAEAVKVSADEIHISPEEIAHQLQQTIEQLLSQAEEIRVRIVNPQIMSALRVRPGVFRIEFPQLKESWGNNLSWIQRNLSGQQNLRAKYLPGGDPEGREFWFRADIVLEQNLPLASVSIARNQILRNEQFDRRWFRLGQNHQQYVTEIENVAGMRLNTSIAQGKPVAYDQVTIPIVIKRGQLVDLKVTSGSLQVASKVKAMEDGGVGELIKVVYPTTKKELDAVIIDSGSVQVSF